MKPGPDDASAVEAIAILGGGLAGLAASIACGAPVFEAENAVGGVAASDSENGFVFDRGIHILQTSNPRVLAQIADSGVRLDDRSRLAFIHSHGTYTAYPFQVNTAGLPLGLRLRCVAGFLLRDGKSEPENYEEWMYANLGRGFAETFLIPYSEKFWTVHPREMTHEWTGNRVPQPRTAQVLRGALWSRQTRIGTNVDFRYPGNRPGFGAIPEALAGRAGPIHTGHRVERIDSDARAVFFANGRILRYRQLITTLPLPRLIAMCPDAPDEVRLAASRLRTNSIFVVNLGIGRPGRRDCHWAHFPEKDVSFFRLSYPHNLAENVVPAGMSSISAEVAYSAAHPVDRETIVDRVIADLIRVRAMPADAPIVLRTTRDIPNAYCIYDHDRKPALRTIRDWLSTRDIITAGRYGLWSYLWSDEAMNSGVQAAEKALARADASHAAG